MSILRFLEVASFAKYDIIMRVYRKALIRVPIDFYITGQMNVFSSLEFCPRHRPCLGFSLMSEHGNKGCTRPFVLSLPSQQPASHRRGCLLKEVTATIIA